ncbi:competence/damage-inducible protein A [Mucilaginibacter phyllosphaerae]|uniref:CinA-like protein n=1 Tax=Mucilaginibacter phyllosphaerae TaxID=1812349 RepID=A0A4Y8A6U7_9SPHI|nr:competence/damage-inducible protein A [Mucilaginibacter phyllosphaerae]MBB3970937.1 nicotinamide-nucleotide amidase [Mucilaginibacter phyllosphaerae]TEW64130.1 competence/damage-inducible protein A [Mucilaginibacter phyllosphaerae]GGH05554.1 CinA-like protein [Mucilaginibacter phyllosphaerae]
MLAEIITIGDEILIGQIVDTNSAWMAQKLNQQGIRVKQISSVSDDKQHILNALTEAATRADIIFITGGLGPTKDDITKQTLAEYFNVKLVLNEDALNNVFNIFKRYNRPMLDVNRKQAEVPENCEVILNNNGTAPGMWFNTGGKIYVSMPGVPFEMMYMMEDTVIPKLKASLKLPVIIHKTILTVGEGESYLAEKIADIENDLPHNIKLAYLPKMGQVRLRLSAYGNGEASLQDKLEEFAGRIAERVGHNVVALEDTPLEKVVLNYMQERGLKLSAAESCTGGYISHLLTQHAGSSAVFLGSAITYDNRIKEKIAGVNHQTLETFGAVSEQTAREMAEGVLSRFGTDYSIAVTGIAGPGGGSEDKPVGTVWIAAAKANKTVAKKFTFGNKRMQNIERSAVAAFFMLITLLKES